MNTWIWLHPLRGGAFLVNLSNVCYLYGTDEGNTKLMLSNKEEMIVRESEDYILDLMKKGK